MIFAPKLIDYEYEALENEKFINIKLSDIKTKYILLIFYPLNFTFVCPTELTRCSQIKDQFIEQNCTVLFVSVDSVYSHLAWTKMPQELGGIGKMEWPMISDINKKLSSQFGLFCEETGTCMRSSVILNNNLEVLHMSVNMDPVGRSSRELIRLLKALNLQASNGQICPMDLFD